MKKAIKKWTVISAACVLGVSASVWAAETNAGKEYFAGSVKNLSEGETEGPEWDGPLPIGSVVLLKNSEKRLMITGYLQANVNELSAIYDYCGCLYPEGYIGGDQVYMFDQDQIDTIYSIGYVDEEQENFMDRLLEIVEDEYELDEMAMSNPRDDTDVLKRWFPNLDGVEGALWEGEMMSEENDRIPGPSTAHACGFIYLTEDAAAQYMSTYNWTECNPDIKATSFDASAYEDNIWYVSDEFESDCKPMYFAGNFYFDGVCIWFDIVR